MVILEMRDAAYDTAFELLDEAKHSAKKTKLTLCELEDAMYDCYEASKEDKESYEPEEEDSEMEFRNRMARRSDYRHDEHYGKHDDEDDNYESQYGMRRSMRRSSSRGGMRMRRNRMGRFV